jgi:hypothetical protein
MASFFHTSDQAIKRDREMREQLRVLLLLRPFEHPLDDDLMPLRIEWFEKISAELLSGPRPGILLPARHERGELFRLVRGSKRFEKAVIRRREIFFDR